jgi:hypothetical protein
MTPSASFTLLSFLLAAGASLSAGSTLAAQGPGYAQPVVQPTGPAADLNAHLARLGENPRDVTALIGAGEAALALDDPRAATGFFARADEIAGNNGRIKAGLARAMVQMQNPAEALKLFDQTQRLGYSAPEMLVDRGLARDLNGDQAAAQADYAQALKAMPQDPALLKRYAVSLGISGKVEAADEVLKPLLFKNDREAWRDRAFILAMNGRRAEALDITNRTMPAPLAQAIQPYMERMSLLTAAQRAAAVHFGRFPPNIRTAAVPPDAPAPAPAASAATVAADTKRPGNSRSRNRGTTIAAATPASPAPAAGTRASSSVQTPPPLPSPSPATVRSAPRQPTTEPARAAAAVSPPPRISSPALSSPALSSPALAQVVTSQHAAPPPSSPPPSSPARQPVATAPAPTPLASQPAAARPVQGPPAPEEPVPATARPAQPASAPAPTAVAPQPQPGPSSPPPAPSRPAGDAPPPNPAATRTLADIIRELDVPEAERQASVAAVDLGEVARLQAERRKAQQLAAADKAEKAKKDAAAKARAEADAKARADAAEKARLAKNPSRNWVQVGTGRDLSALAFTLRGLRKDHAAIAKQSAYSAAWGRTNRLVIGPFASFARARDVEAELKKAGADAFAWRSEAGEELTPIGGK